MVRMFERKEMGFEELKELFFSWERAVSEAEGFLLDPARILCLPDYIYYDLSKESPEWIFYPGQEERTLPLGLTELAEFLLEKVNHRDARAVDIAYRFYRSAKEGTFLLPEMIKALNDATVMEREPVTEEEPLYIPDEMKTEKEPKEEEEDEKDFLGVLAGIFRKKKKEPGRKRESFHTEKKEKTEYGGNPSLWEREESEEEIKKTRLIGEEKSEARRELKNIATRETYSLKKLPVVVGKMESAVDIYLDDDSVSRLHARFFEEDGETFIEDLNSTNGCAVNDIPLENNEKVPVSPGDRILIGALEFIFH